MEATRDHDPSAPQAAISKSFAPGAAGKEQEAGRNGAGAGPPSQDGDILLEDSEDRNPRLDEQGDGRVPIRAPISDSAEDVGDSEESFGSGESFDSTLEGMAASSTTSNEAFASPKGSPDQFYSAPGVLAGVEASSSQQGALMRLNELNSGVSSLDPALISSSGTAEEFSARVTQIAQKNDLSADDTVVKNILDLLIPLVHNVNRLSANGNGAGAGDAAEDLVQADEARPVAKVTAENNDDPLNNSDEDDSLDDEPDGEEVEEIADRADSEDLHAEDESEVHGTQSAQGLRVVGRNEVELEEATTTPISGSESVQNRAVADDGTIDSKTELDEGKVDATTESSAPVHDDRTKTELDEGKVDATTESAAPVHEDRSKSDSPESARVLPESHLYHRGDDTKLKIEEETVDSDEKSDTKSENPSLHEHDNILSTVGEKNTHRAEKATEHKVHSEESDKDQEAVSESLNLELQNLQEEESDPQKQKEEELQKLREKDIEPEKEENQYPELQQHPKEEISESTKSKEEFTEYQEPEAHRAEAGVEAMLEPVVEDQQIDAETGNLCESGSHHHQLQNAQNLEGSDGSDEAKGGLEVTNEGIVVAEPKVAKLNEIDQGISSESDDQKQGISVDSHVEHEKEAVHLDAAEGKEIPEEPNLADSSPSVLTPPVSTEDAETVDHTSEDTRASAGIELESVKDKGDATEDADEEVATPKDADEHIATPKDAFKDSVLEEIKPSDTGSPPQDSATEPIIHSVKKDHEGEKETEALKEGAESQVEEYVKPKVKEDERTDAHGVEDQQSQVEDSASLTRKISGGSESIEEETKLEGNLRNETKEKSNGDLPTVVPLQESLEKGDISALVDDNATALEQFQPAADTKSKNQSSVDPLNGSSVSVSFKEEDDDEEGEDSYWNEKEINDDDEDEDEEDALQSSAALAALVRAVDSSGGGTGTPSLGSAGPSLPARPAGLGRSMPSLEPAPRAAPQPSSNGVAASRPSAPAENNQPNGEANDANSETREKLQAIRVKFLRLAHRLGQSAQNVVVAQVLYRLGLAEQLRGGGQSASRSSAFSFDRASAIAEEQEAAGQEELDFTCTIMLLGKTGVGKSATINSIFDEVKAPTSAFTFATKKVQEITGTVHGIKLRVIDTPGLLPSVADQRQNEKIMASVKRFIKKSPPDIVLYFDRLDMQSRDFGDIPLLRTITDTFGAAIWFNAIVVLTHASSAPPDGPNGVPVSYEMFVAQRSHVVQQTIRQAAGDTRLMNPVSLVENHTACRTNRAGERVLPNGQIWKPQLLLLSFASKILAEANSLLKLQESTPGKPFATRSRVPPLPFLLSSLLQSRAQLKMPEEQMGDEDESDEDVEDDESDDEVEYDELPPFRRLSKDEIEELDKEQRRLYFEELEDREKLFQKKQWKEELRRRKEMKKRMATAQKADLPPPEEVYDEDGGKSAAVPVALPDMALPPSFDSDNPSHRYRYLEMSSQWLVRPVLETHGWDHDSGYDGLNLEKMFIVGNKVPVSLSGQITKDKKEANVTLESAASLRHGEGKVTLAGIDVQTMGKDLSYTLRSETRFSNFKHNKTIAGLAVTMLGDTIAAGLKLEDRLLLGKRLKLVMNGGAITGRGDMAYGGTMEISLRGKDYPISRTLSTLGFSVMDWHGDLAIGGNLQSQFMMGKTMLVARGNLNNRGAGQISIRASSSEQFQMALIGIIPIVRALFGNRLFSSSRST